jgi:uncharacterized protein (DUF433 family)
MNLVLQAEAPPLRQDASGALRVGESRVLLDLVVRAFQQGATPEAIVQRYSALALADTYSAIAYYLRHRSKVEAYLLRRETQARDIRQQIEAADDLSDIRAQIQARGAN